jgi:hypothetical protein
MRTAILAGVLLAAILGVAPLAAHHSFAAEFDGDKPVVLTGAVTKVEWRNPHIWVYLDVKDAAGKVTAWQCEGPAPNNLTRQGWSRDTLKQGQEITVEGWRAKDGTNTCNGGAWKLPGGQAVFTGSRA